MIQTQAVSQDSYIYNVQVFLRCMGAASIILHGLSKHMTCVHETHLFILCVDISFDV